jgi:hypothetical protein
VHPPAMSSANEAILHVDWRLDYLEESRTTVVDLFNAIVLELLLYLLLYGVI